MTSQSTNTPKPLSTPMQQKSTAKIGRKYQGNLSGYFPKPNQDPVNMMVSIIRTQHSKFSKEVDDFKMAILSAENVQRPNRFALMRIYKDVMDDMFFFGQIQNQRINKILNKKFKITNSKGEALEELNSLFNHAWFRDLIQWSMESIFYGFSLAYVYDVVPGMFKQFKLVPRDHVVPEWSLVEFQPMTGTGMYFDVEPESNYVLPIGSVENMGLLKKLAIPYILKRHSWQSWDEFEEMFGVPIRTATSASQDPRVRAEMEAWLADMGQAAYGIFPQGTELKIYENKQTDSFQVFNEKRKAINEEAAILINGQTGTSMAIGSRSQGEVHQETSDEIELSDKIFISCVVNDQIIPLMRRFGYAIPEDAKFEYDDAKQLDPETLSKIVMNLGNAGYSVDVVELSKRMGIEITLKQVPVKQAPASKTNPQAVLKMHEEIQKLYHHVQ